MGFAEALFGPTNPFAMWANQNQNALGSIGAGIASGTDFGSGLAKAAQYLPEGRKADDAYATQQKAEQERQAQINETVQWLQQTNPDLASMVEAGMPVGEAWGEALRRNQPKAPQAPLGVSPGETLLDPTTYQPLYTGAPDPKDAVAADKENFDRESALGKEYTSADPIKTYTVVRDSYERVRQSASQQTGAGDMGLIYGYMKMLDPGSVVRESEFAMAAQAGSFGEQIQGMVTRLMNGERLPDNVRQQFIANADALYKEAAANAQAINDQFGERAGSWNVDPTRFVRPVEQYQPLTLGVPTPSAKYPGVTITKLP